MKQVLNSLIIAISMMGCYIAYDFFYRTPKEVKEAAYWRDKAFKTDTVFHETFKLQTVLKGAEKMPPASVNYYNTGDAEQMARMVKQLNTLLEIIDTNKKTKVEIQNTYLTQFPEAHKIITGNFSKDSTLLTVLGIDGKLRTEIYPVDYSLFKYQYLNNSMTATPLSTRNSFVKQKARLFRLDGAYIYYEQGLVTSSKALEATVGADLWKLRLNGFANYPLNSSTLKPNAGLRVGIRLF